MNYDQYEFKELIEKQLEKKVGLLQILYDYLNNTKGNILDEI